MDRDDVGHPRLGGAGVLTNTGKDNTVIAKAAIPFFFCLVICIALITVFPQIVTVVPGWVMGAAK